MSDITHPQSERGVDTAKLLTGLLLVTIGAAFLLDQLFWFDIRDMLRLWPLWLIAFGVIRVAWPRRGRSRIAGLWPIAIGGVFLLDTLRIMSINDSWPVFIVLAGLLMVLRSVGVDRCCPPRERVR